jgi:osmotically-inducible protein OsmY
MRFNYFRFVLITGTLTGSLWISGCAPLVIGAAAVGGATIAHDRRTTGTIVDDQAIETKSIAALYREPDLMKQSHINVTSYNNVVLLTGETPTEALRTRAGEIARGIEHVRRVYNELTIAAPSSYMNRSSDSWLTAQVKAHFIEVRNIKGFDPTRVKVVSENGTVYLMGLVSRREGDAAAESARQVGGVQRVIKLFEYTD